MNLRVKMALLFSVLVACILLVSSYLVYVFYADLRKDEFYFRLEQKALTTYRLLADVKEIDKKLLQQIDKNTLNELYNEKILVFDENYHMIYSSIDDHTVNYSRTLLEQTRKAGKLQLSNKENELLCLYINESDKQAFIIASAYDKYGRRKMESLKVVLILVLLGSIIITSLLSYFYVQQVLKPLQDLNRQIKRIGENNLSERLIIKKQQDEISELGLDFNNMLERLEKAFKVQKNFIQHASHELRTPLAGLIAQTEVALARSYNTEQIHELLLSLNEDQKNLASLVDALLILSKYENLESAILNQHRVDEILDKAIEEIKSIYPHYQISLDYKEIPENESELEIPCRDVLLKSAFSNLIRNACIYSDNETVHINIDVRQNEVVIVFINNGPIISLSEQSSLYIPFFRGGNAGNKKGFGIGLSIVKRIIELHKGTIQYSINTQNENSFCITLPKVSTIA